MNPFRLSPSVPYRVVALFLGLAALGAWEGPAGAGESAQPRPLILSASEIDYPLFSIVDADGWATGFSVELMRAALRAMGREVTFRTGPWAEVKGLLEKGEIQALPLVGRTPEREAIFDFTFPYMSLHGAIVVRKDTPGILTMEDLRGRRVAVMKGDNAEEFLRREERGIEIRLGPWAEIRAALARGETVLVVEDEAAIRKLTATMLERLGYTVLSAGGPLEGVALAERHAGRIDLLITDVVMPEMNGRALADRLHGTYPDMKTLFMSGYTADVIAHRGVLEEGVNFIQKPFTMNDLACRVREVLDA